MGAVILVNVVVAFVALALGILLSSFASSEFQMMQFIPVVIVPQIFFSGLFPLENMANWVQGLSKIMPLYYAAEAQTGIMYKGQTLAEVMIPVLILLGIALVFILLNILALKRYRKL